MRKQPIRPGDAFQDYYMRRKYVVRRVTNGATSDDRHAIVVVLEPEVGRQYPCRGDALYLRRVNGRQLSTLTYEVADIFTDVQDREQLDGLILVETLVKPELTARCRDQSG